MYRPCLAIALLTMGCGEVAKQAPADASIDAPQAVPVAYHGALAATSAIAFGGAPYCDYKETLEQITVDLTLVPQPSGPALVATGHVENLNHEAPATTCANGTITDKIARYDFAPPTPMSSAAALAFTADPGNAPVVALSVQVMQAGDVYQATLGFHRTDSPAAILNWSVVAAVALSQR